MGSDPSDSRQCARCGSPIAPGARFCGHCGLTVSTDLVQPPPERPHDGSGESAAGTEGGADIVGEFSLGARLLGQHPVMIVPPLIAMAVVFVAAFLLFGGAISMFAVGGFAGRRPMVAGAVLGTAVLFLVCAGVAMLMNLVSSAVVVVMAKDALAGRAPSMSAAYGVVVTRLGDVVGASLLCALIIGVTSIFLVIPGLIAAFFLMFTLPVVLLERAGPTEGLRRSAGLVGNNLGRVAGLIIGAMVAGFITWVVSIVLHVIPVVGHIASMLLAGVFFTYLTVVAVHVFQTLPRR